MKKFLYILGGLILLIVVLAVAGLIYLQVGFPKVSPAEDITIEATPERLARGEYLAKHVTMCFDCHSTRNHDYFSAPIVAGTEGKGGDLFPGVPGTLYTTNITPAGLKDWTDGEIARAITSGVDKDDNPLAPMMPFTEYSHLTEEDIHAIVAYLRTIPAIENENPIPEPSMNFPVNLIFRTVPADAKPQPLPEPSDSLAMGKYLLKIGGCMFCHTPVQQGTPIPGKEFSGGHEFADPKLGTLRSSNITPDMETGIGSWSKDAFIGRFKAYADSSGSHMPIATMGFQTVMPWTLQAGMTEEDLSAIYAYLQSIDPIPNKVERFTPPQN